MSQKTQGVQALLEAERKAAEIVQGARDCKLVPCLHCQVLSQMSTPEFNHEKRRM